MIKSQTPRTDEEEALYRAEWLSAYRAPLDWIVMTTTEVFILKSKLLTLQVEVEKLKSDWDADAASRDACLREAHQENDRLKAAIAPLLKHLDEGGATTGGMLAAIQTAKAAMESQ